MFAYFLRYLFSLSWHTQQRLHKGAEFLHLLRISEFFGFQWQNLAEILSLLPKGHFWPILGHLGPFRVIFWPSWVILGHAWKWFIRFFCRESVNAAITHIVCCKCRIYALFLSRMSWLRAFWGRILAEILRNTQNFGRNSEEKIGLWSLWWDQ